ncbi:MAG: glycosyltransferase [Anaerolineae bacterium]|nr:glycosyltransferase [Anaerolineae bacterium]
MRVVHVIKVKGIAGAENHLLTLLPGLKARDLDIHLIYLHNPGQPVEAFYEAAAAAGIPTQKVVIHGSADPLLSSRLIGAFRRLQPDIVHTHLLHADLYGIPAAWGLKLRGKRPRVVSSKHNDDQFRLSKTQRALNHQLWRMTDRGIAISEAVRRFSIDVEGAAPEKIETIYYGLPPPAGDPLARRKAAREKLNIAPETVVVGVTCRLVEQKGLAYGLDAFAQAAQNWPEVQLVITGDGDLRGSLEAQAKTLGIAGRTRFLGWRDDAAEIMAAYDIFLMPSLWEGFGLVLLEAMAQSVPVIASRVSAIPEIVAGGETGLLAEPRDVQALAAHLALLIGDAPLRRHLGMVGQDRLETRFNAQEMIRRTAAVYAQAAQK